MSASQFLQLFLFSPDQQYTYISQLSGGEKRRLHLLSILFRNPNFLILDEPTNDLDLPTLAVLENFLSDYQGCMIIVSHDRYFMDRLVDHLLIMEGDGEIRDFPGNYSQYREQIGDGQEKTIEAKKQQAVEPPDGRPGASKKKLSYKEKREFELLEKEIKQLESEKNIVTQKLNAGDTPFNELQQLSIRIGEINNLLDEKELRWLELSELEK